MPARADETSAFGDKPRDSRRPWGVSRVAANRFFDPRLCAGRNILCSPQRARFLTVVGSIVDKGSGPKNLNGEGPEWSGARRELDEHLGLGALIERHLTDPRSGRNRQFALSDLFRQSIYSRLAGYEDTNDTERLAVDPTFRMLAARERRETGVAITSTLHWFETEVLTEEDNYQGLARLNTDVVQGEAMARCVILDIDSSESPVHGAQEQSSYNGHFESVCYHPLFVFNQKGGCLAAKLRPGNVPRRASLQLTPAAPRSVLRGSESSLPRTPPFDGTVPVGVTRCTAR